MGNKTDSKISWEERKILIDGYMRLAAAIVNSGKKSGDRVFLESEWCQTLKTAVAGWQEAQQRKQVQLPL